MLSLCSHSGDLKLDIRIRRRYADTRQKRPATATRVRINNRVGYGWHDHAINGSNSDCVAGSGNGDAKGAPANNLLKAAWENALALWVALVRRATGRSVRWVRACKS